MTPYRPSNGPTFNADEGTTPFVLVVDDDKKQLAMLVGIVRSVLTDWTIRTAASEMDAYDQIDALQGHIGAAVVDLRLAPESDVNNGIQVLRRLRETDSKCFNIMVSMRARDRIEIDDALAQEGPRLADRQVSLRYIDADPVTELQSALFEARRKFEA